MSSEGNTKLEVQKQQEQDRKAQELQVQYNKFQEALGELENQLGTIMAQVNEHNIVDNTLSSIPPAKRGNRKCFKMIGGVLVEKSIDEVIRMLDDEKKSLTSLRELLEKELINTRNKRESWMKSNNVKILRKGQP